MANPSKNLPVCQQVMDLDRYDLSFCSMRLMHVQSCLSFFPLLHRYFFQLPPLWQGVMLGRLLVHNVQLEISATDIRKRHSYPCSVSWFNRIDLQSQQKGPLLSHSWRETNRRAGNAFDRSSMRWMCAISKLKCEVESLTNSFCQREWVKRVQALGLRSLLSLLLLWKTSRGVCWAHVHVYFRSTRI